MRDEPLEGCSTPSGEPTASLGAGIAIQYGPATSAFRKYLTLYAIASLGIGLLWGAVTIVLMPLQVQSIEFSRIFTGSDANVNLQTLNDLAARAANSEFVPTAEQDRLLNKLAQFNSSRATSLSVVTSVAVLLTTLIQPIVGMLSNRTRSGWGRRAPWIASGGVVGAALVALLPVAPTIAVLVAIWSVVQLVVNIAQGPLAATVADRVPDERLGWASAITGLIAYLAVIAGSVMAGSLFALIGLATYYPIALMIVLGTTFFVLFARDKSSKSLIAEPLDVSTFLDSYSAALRDHDYRWAWIAKVLLYIGYGIGTVYAIYMLQSYVQPALSAEQAAKVAPLLSFAGLPGTLIAMLIAGRWSDRIRRRKPFVVAASLIMACSFSIPFVWPSLPALFIQAVAAGIGFGVFLVVDQALFIDVLPDRKSAGRDLGLSTLGQNLGQALGPVLAGAVVAISAGSYAPVWPAASLLVIVSAFAILPVKRVR